MSRGRFSPPARDGTGRHRRSRPLGTHERSDASPADACRGTVPDDARHVSDERLDRDGREGCRHNRDRNPGRDHGVHPGDGRADDHRRKDRRDDRPQAGLRDRLRHLRVRVADDVPGAQPAGPLVRLVVPRGPRRRPDPSLDRRAGSRELPGRATSCRVRPRRRRRRRRGRGWPADRRLLHDLLLLAVGVRRGGRDRARDPRPGSAHRGCTAGVPSPPRLRRCGALGSGSGRARLRHSPLERVGLDPAQGRRPVMGRRLADALADPDRVGRNLGLLPLGSATRVARQGAARTAGDAAQPPAGRRADHVLLPVSGSGGPLLRRPALPVGVPRALGPRDRRPAAAALDHAAHRRDRDPAALSERLAAPSSQERPARAACWHARSPRNARRGCGSGGRVRADAPGRARDRGTRLATRRRHRLRSPRRPGPGGRRRAEHGDEPRRVDRHRPGGLDPDRRDDLVVLREHPAEPRDPGLREIGGARETGRWGAVRLGCRPRGCPRQGERRLEAERGGPPRLPRRPHRGAESRPGDPRRPRPRRPLLRAADPDAPAGSARGSHVTSNHALDAPTAAPPATFSRRKFLLPLALAQFICSFAGSNMNVMINDISEDLNTTVKGVQTAITLFLLIMAILMIPGSKLTDRWGRKRCFVGGLVLYGIGAVLSAVSPNLGVLILGNSVFEGVGTALLIPPVYILTTLAFSDVTSRAKAFGTIMGAAGIGAAAGPLIGGLITTGISWRAAFVFQALVVAAIVLLSRRGVVDPLPPDPERPFDTLGAVLSGIGLFSVVFAILQIGTENVLAAVFAAIGTVFLLWFFLYIRRRERAGKEVLLSTALFRNRTSDLALVTQNIQWLMLMGTSFVVAVYLQEVRGFSAIKTGVVFTAATVGVLPTSLLAERFAKRRSQKTLIVAGFVGAIAGIVLLIVLVRAWSNVLAFVPGLFVIGAGLGIMLTPSVNVVQSSFPEEQQGEISGLSRSISNLGSSLGTAIAGTILVSAVATGNRSYVWAMIALAVAGAIGLVGALFLPRKPPPSVAYDQL